MRSWWRLQYERPFLGALAFSMILGLIALGKFRDVRAGLIAAAISYPVSLLLLMHQRRRWATLDEYLAAAEENYERAEARRRDAPWWKRPFV